MMKKLILLTFLVFFTFSANSQNGICEGGDCKNGYGNYYDKATNEIYNGYFSNGKFNGVSQYSNKDGFYYSYFIDGKMNGFTAYYQNGKFYVGMFKNGIKEGVHIQNTDVGNTLNRAMITYSNGKEISREDLLVNSEIFKSGRDCLSGNCSNGNGIAILKAQSLLLIGKFENSRLVLGEYLALKSGDAQFFASPKDVSKPYFKFEKMRMKDGGFLELAGMYIRSKKNGQVIMYQTKSQKSNYGIYKDGKLVK